MNLKNLNWILLSLLTVSQGVVAKSYEPEDNFVLLTLDEIDAVRMYRKKLIAEPDNAQLLIKAMKELVAKAKKENSDLLFGKIESILVKYNKIVLQNSKLKIIYADVLQHRHAFDNAKYYLDKIDTAEANLMRATIYQNLGEYSKANTECKKLLAKANILIASTCIVHSRSYQGNLNQSYAALKKMFLQLTNAGTESKFWVVTALADMAHRKGSLKESLEYYELAHKLSPGNKHIMSEWVDVLYGLDEQRKIITLLKNNHQDMRLNLRYQRSLIELNMFDSAVHNKDISKLNNLITITELRQDQRHYDTRAEYYIWINKNPEKAFHWAQKNWSVSKTPTAARLLLLASRLSNNTRVISEISGWLEKSKIEDDSLFKMLAFLAANEIVA